MVSVSNLPTTTQNYLKVIWGLQEWSDEAVTATDIARRMGLKLSTVSDAIRRLDEQGLVEHARYGRVTLTEQGCTHALAMVRRHRLIETFLIEVLHYRWDEVHEEAEHLEHSVSDMLVDRIDDVLGHPRRDPHGDPIPAADGSVQRPPAIPIAAIRNRSHVRVERISDTDPALLKFLAERSIVIGTELDVNPPRPFSDAVELTIPGEAEPIILGAAASAAVWVCHTQAPPD